MFGSGKRETAVVVVRDSEEVVEALREALETAPEEERAGLERAVAVATAAAEGLVADEARARAEWTRRRLEAVGFSGPLDSVRAVKALREAEPSLSLRTAVELTREAARRD
ncbi:hypothetical protein GCM10010420_06110 [Streptomyces glaucosporus]|uniref:ANTAR domain-containing protein n=1 Tax=Streptomyces glaucosporus TaxID=284044 RepID=A0ABN3HS41_9ACTN